MRAAACLPIYPSILSSDKFSPESESIKHHPHVSECRPEDWNYSNIRVYCAADSDLKGGGGLDPAAGSGTPTQPGSSAAPSSGVSATRCARAVVLSREVDL